MLRLMFEVYDFDKDGKITVKDVVNGMNSL